MNLPIAPRLPHHTRPCLWLALIASVCLPLHSHADARVDAKAILDATGVKGGIVLQLGVGDGRLTAALRAGENYQVQALDTDAAKVAQAREAIRKQGAYGPVSVDTFNGRSLPYIENLVNLVVTENLGNVPMAEVMRVLVPNGVAYVKQGGKWTKSVKPRPAEMDDWTHYFYDAKGNATSKDLLVAPPDRLQWVGSPRWSRHHDRMASMSAQVSGGGRLFYIMDEGSRVSILLPPKWHLIARDAFNGTILWKRPMGEWHSTLWPLKSGPTQLTRRLVADGDSVFVTLGFGEPVVRLDAATGETLATYDATRGAEEILHVNGRLYTLVNPEKWALAEFAPQHNTGDQKRVETEFNWDEKPRHLVVVDAQSGKVVWRQDHAKIAPLTLAADGQRVVYYNGDNLVCLNAANGQEKWAGTPATKRKLFEYNYTPRVVLHGSTLLYAGGDGAMKGVDADTGRELWNSSHEKSGYRSPEDLIVAGGLVWNAGTLSGNQKGEFTGRDPRTGEVKKQFAPDVPEGTYWFHHRCYIAKATERFIIPSRTGIEFVDHVAEHWDLNHWVRGACLYGVMPSNGLVYAGPHNCACYPEAKLDGMNALAGGRAPHPAPVPDAQRLVRGPAWSQPLDETPADAKDWPTYRHDAARSGYTDQALLKDMGKAWDIDLPGPLSALTIAAGKLFVAQVDAHTVHALDMHSGRPVWSFTAGARVDSPPTYWKGRVIFGGKDGKVYCLRASDGALIWSYLAAPNDVRHTAWEQMESVWPVHGSVLVENGVVSFVAGRSVFLDGGLRFFRLEAATGKKLVEVAFDDKDPETGKDFQEKHMTLQMPVGLNDILSSDGKWIYLRSQKIDPQGKRHEIGPTSANAAQHGGAQQGEGAHIFAPMGFLDDSWFHRSYWVYGKNFAGGHNGYYQAGKYAPAGRLLVFDDKNVYGYGREAKYLKWTTTMEHQLFSASREIPKVAVQDTQGGKAKAKGKAGPAAAPTPSVKFATSEKLDPSNKALTVEAWVMPDGPTGVIVQHGGSRMGYALAIEEGRPGFSVRSQGGVMTARSARALENGWNHLAGVLTDDKRLLLYVNGEPMAETKVAGLIESNPNLGLELGGAASSLVSDFGKGAPYTGLVDQFAIFHRALAPADILQHALQGNATERGKGALVAASFDNGDARDESGNNLHGVLSGVETGKGKVGAALWFQKTAAASVIAGKGRAAPDNNRASFVEHHWTRFVPMFTRAMAMAGKTMFLSGPPDSVDEEYAFERLTQKDNAIHAELAEQDAALEGKRGAHLWMVSTENGSLSQEVKLPHPPVWDGMAIAHGRLFVATTDGKVTCFGKP